MGCAVSNAKYTTQEDIFDVLQRKDLPRLKFLLGKKHHKSIINDANTRLVTVPNHDSIMASVTPLLYAIIIDSLEAVTMMCGNNAVDVNLSNDFEENCSECHANLTYTPFTVAIALQRKPIVDFLFNHSLVDREKGCPPPLCVAAMSGNFEAAALLVKHPSASKSFGKVSPLRVAIEAQQIQMVNLIIEHLPPDPAGLVYASSHPSVEIVEALLKAPSIDPNATVDFNLPGSESLDKPHSAFYRAIVGMRSQRRLGAQPKSFPICTCRRTPALPCLQLLLQCGQTPMCMCADLPYHSPVTGTTILEMLLKSEKVDPNIGAYPLRLAVSQVNLRAIKLLVKHPLLTTDHLTEAVISAVKDVKDREVGEVMQVLLGLKELPIAGQQEESSPLLLAARLHRPTALRCLLNAKGVDVNAAVRYDLQHEFLRMGRSPEEAKLVAPPAKQPTATALYVAIQGPGEPDDVYATVKTLLTNHAVDPNKGFTTSDGCHFSPLICAMEEKRWNIAEEIIAHPKTNINQCEPSPLEGARELSGRSPLFMAIQADQTETVDCLLNNPNLDTGLGMVVNGRRVSCLHQAVTNYKAPMVEALLRSPGLEIQASLLSDVVQLLQQTDRVHTPQNKVRQQALLKSANALMASSKFPEDQKSAQDLKLLVDQLSSANRGKKGTAAGSKPMLTQLLAGAL